MTTTLLPAAKITAEPQAKAVVVRNFRIPGDVVNRATADLPDDQRSAIRWLHHYAIEHDLSLADLGRKLRYDSTTLHRVFHGRYEGNLSNVCREITDFRRLEEERNNVRPLTFIATALSKRIWQVCDASLEFQRIAFIFGDTQIGKTAALKEYARRRNHGSIIYVEMPTGGYISHFTAVLAGALRIGTNDREREIRRRIISAFDDRMMLIVDEVHRTIRQSGRSAAGLQSIDFLRELFDAARCGMVLCATDVFRHAMDASDTAVAGVLKQTRRRRLCSLRLPDMPPRSDLNTFAGAYGLPPAKGSAAEIQRAVIRAEGLGMWLTLLRMARKLAAREKRKFGWSHVEQAYAGLQEMETM